MTLQIRSVYIPAPRNGRRAYGIMSPNHFLSSQTSPLFSETIRKEEREHNLFLHVKWFFVKRRKKGVSEGRLYLPDRL